MEPEPLDVLQKQYDDAVTFKDSISIKLEETLHQAGEFAEKITRLNSKMALLETSQEPDEVVALKIDTLKGKMMEAELEYDGLMVKESRLQKADLNATNSLDKTQSALKIAQLKSENRLNHN